MQLYAYRNTEASAKHFVPDEGINLAPRCKSPRERIIELAAQWNDRRKPEAPRQALEPRKAKVRVPVKTPTIVRIEHETAEALQIMSDCGMPVWAREIVLSVSRAHKVSPLSIMTRCRKRNVVQARNEAFYRLRSTPSPVTSMIASYPQIASWFGRDHTGVLWGAAKHASEHGLPAMTDYDYGHHSEQKRLRHQINRTALETKEGRG